MAFDNRWEAVLDPGRATDYFAVPGERPSFDPQSAAWQRGLAWWCAEISRTIYRRDGRPEFFARAGLRERCFLANRGTECAIVEGAVAAAGCAVLVFRGTADFRDWLTNLRAAPVAWKSGGRVHAGFARALDQVWDELQIELDRLQTPMFVTGHSLGGALASLAAASRPFTAAYTFGAPRVGDAAFWTGLRCPLFRVVNHRDVVPTVPPRRMGYAHGGALYRITAAGTLASPTDDPEAGSTSELAALADRRRWFDPHESIADHAPVNYASHLLG